MGSDERRLSMRVLYLGNNRLGLDVLSWLVDREDIVGLVINSPTKQKLVTEIVTVSRLSNDRIFLGADLEQKKTLERIIDFKPDIAVSVLFGHILKRGFLDICPVVNLHTGYLPYNRGAHPNVWSIVEGTPAGVTLHWIDEGIDTGMIIAQEKVPIEPIDTGFTLYVKLEEVALRLFKSKWEYVKTMPRGESQDGGTYHEVKDLERIKQLYLDKTYKCGQLVNILRALTFLPYKNAYYEISGKKVYLDLQLKE